MKLIITHALPETGSEFHKQTLYHVPQKTARQIANDFESFANGGSEHAEEVSRCTTYEYVLNDPQSEGDDQADGDDQENIQGEATDTDTQSEGFVTVDFRLLVAVQGYDDLS